MSALDAATEHEITQALEVLRGEKTIILIAHRLGTVRRCDKIYLLENGQVAASGGFEELRRDNPTFQRMVQLNELTSPGQGVEASP